MRQVRTIRYQEIADALRGRVDRGEFGAGRLLPSEAALSTEYGASRVTVRRALEQLRDDGLLDARQGFGWFVARRPIRQSLGRLATHRGPAGGVGHPARAAHPRLRLRRRGRRGSARSSASPRSCGCRRLNLADGEPFAIVTVWCPAELAQHLSRADVERSPFYELLPTPLGGASQTIARGRGDA